MIDFVCVRSGGGRRPPCTHFGFSHAFSLLAAMAVGIMVLATPGPAARADTPHLDPAHALAAKFAADAQQAAERAKAAEAAARRAEARRREAAQQAEASRRTAEAAQRAAQQRKTDEADMLARARAESEAQRVQEARARAEREAAEAQQEAAKRAAEAERKSADAAQRATGELQASEARQRAEAMEDEARRRALFAQRARTEEERIERERLQATVRAEAERRDAAAATEDAARQARQEGERAAEAEARLIEEAKRADAARRQMEVEREVENAALAAKLRRIEEMYTAEHAPKVQPAPLGSPGVVRPANGPAGGEAKPPGADSLARAAPPMPNDATSNSGSDPGRLATERESAAARSSPQSAALVSPEPPSTLQPQAEVLTLPADIKRAPASITRVTVLLVMQPGKRGIRRYNKTADPVLCIDDACYVSKGADSDAWRAPRMRALGSLNTLGGRADACNQSLGCVFRNVDLKAAKAWVQPVDLKLMRHDRRGAREIAADPSCRVDRDRIRCRAMVDGGDYRMWIVPEAVAEAAGPVALMSAVQQDLALGTRAAQRP